MKTTIKSILLLLIGISIGYFIFKPNAKTNDKQIIENHSETVYTCSMHPQVRRNKPELCPLCNMQLIPVNNLNSSKNNNAIEISSAEIKQANVQTTVISKNSSNLNLQLYGKITNNESSVQTIPSHIGGRIEKLYINTIGQSITASQTIALIYSPELISAQTELIEAIKLNNKNTELIEVARKKLLQWHITPQQISQIEKNGEIIEHFEIKANTTGVITNKLVNEGNYISKGQTLFEIANLNTVWAVFDVYENNISSINIGSTVQIQFPNQSLAPLQSTISFIEPTLNPTTRSIKARAVINNSNNLLKPGMYISASVVQKMQNQQITVPKTAVLWTGSQSVVYVKLKNTNAFELQQVQLGQQVTDAYIVISGLNQGDEVVTNGTFAIDAAAQLAGKPSMLSNKANVNLTTQTQNTNQTVKDTQTTQTSVFTVAGSCEMCKQRIQEAALKLNGVNLASWNINTGLITVEYQPKKIKLNTIKKTIAAAGHDAGVYKANSQVYNNLPACCKYNN